MITMKRFLPVVSRVLMMLIFLIFGLDKIGNIPGTQGYMKMMGLNGTLIYPTILFEIGAAVAIMIGYKTRLFAGLCAAFCIVSAIIFHAQLEDQMQFIMFMKNISMAGGFLVLMQHGAGAYSLDNKLAAKA